MFNTKQLINSTVNQKLLYIFITNKTKTTQKSFSLIFYKKKNLSTKNIFCYLIIHQTNKTKKIK